MKISLMLLLVKQYLRVVNNFTNKVGILKSNILVNIEIYNQLKMKGQISNVQIQTNSEQIKTNSAHKIDQFQTNPKRKKYGNLKVIYKNGSLLISLGPKYIVFIIMSIFMSISEFFICYLVYSTISSINAFYIIMTLSCFHVCSYIVVSLSNPGVVLPNQQLNDTMTQEQKTMICSKCGAHTAEKIRHCIQCDVCVQGYDHHCGWVTKCIGKGNLYKFYFFVVLTPVYIIASILLIATCFILDQTTNGDRNLRGNLFS